MAFTKLNRIAHKAQNLKKNALISLNDLEIHMWMCVDAYDGGLDKNL